LNERLRLLPESNLKDTHFNEEDMLRRLKFYRALTDNSAGQNTIYDFFMGNNFKLFEVKIDGNLNNEELLNKMVCYIEREGKFLNFIDNVTVVEETRKMKADEVRELKSLNNIFLQGIQSFYIKSKEFNFSPGGERNRIKIIGRRKI
jgi:hypothetical protein